MKLIEKGIQEEPISSISFEIVQNLQCPECNENRRQSAFFHYYGPRLCGNHGMPNSRPYNAICDMGHKFITFKWS
jgi:hypothetical protein